jgi:hypothetical protein
VKTSTVSVSTILLIASIVFISYSNSAYAVNGDSITQVQSLEHDTDFGEYSSLVQVDSDTYALAYAGPDSAADGLDGSIKTFTISADGSTITEVQSLVFNATRGFHNSLVQVDSDTYALAYAGTGNAGTIETFTISADGTIITEVELLQHDTLGQGNSLVQVDSDTYALAYAGDGNSFDGFIKTFTISADGTTITEVESLEHDIAQGTHNSLVQVDSDTYALAYAGDGGDDGYIKTFTIPADGSTITEVFSLEHDATQGELNSLVQVDSDTYALAYGGDGGGDGYIKTFTIPTDGSTITEVFSLEHDTAQSVYPSLVQVDSDTYALAYGGDGGSDGYIKTFTIAEVAVSVTLESSGGGGCTGDCVPPTLGVDKNGKRIVTDGFVYNGNPIDVELFFTAYPLITAIIGEQNIAEFKIYENMGPNSVKHFSFAFGLADGQIISQSKAVIELDIDHEGKQTVTITDPQNVLDDVKVTATDDVDCNGDGKIKCLKVTIHHTFRASLDFDIVGTDVWDNKRNAWQNYYNHGIHVDGQSLNTPNTYDGISKGYIYHLTETGKNTAVDEFGHTWSYHHGIWNKDFVKPVRSLTSLTNPHKILALEKLGVKNGAESFGYTSYDPEFAVYKKGQEMYAQKTLNDICPRCSDDSYDKINNIVLYEDKITTRNGYGADLEELMVQEDIRAQKYLDELFEYYYGNTHGINLDIANYNDSIK